MNMFKKQLAWCIKKNNLKKLKIEKRLKSNKSRECRLKEQLSFLEKYNIQANEHWDGVSLNLVGEGYKMNIHHVNKLFHRYEVYVYHLNTTDKYKVNKWNLMKIIFDVFIEQFRDLK